MGFSSPCARKIKWRMPRQLSFRFPRWSLPSSFPGALVAAGWRTSSSRRSLVYLWNKSRIAGKVLVCHSFVTRL